MKTSRAYTFIELCIVIMMLGILAATALPRLFNFNTNAYRTLNLETAAALNTKISTFISGVPLRSQTQTFSNWTLNGVNYGSAYRYPIVNSNPAVYLCVLPSNYLIACAANGVDNNGGNDLRRSPQAGCSDLFNGLMGLNSNIQTSYSGYESASWNLYKTSAMPNATKPSYTSSAYLTAADSTNPTGVNGAGISLIISPTAPIIFSNSSNSGISSLQKITTSNLPQTIGFGANINTQPGGCLYKLSASASGASSVFYIYYSQGLFTPIEVQ